jgi:hypothetical protein
MPNIVKSYQGELQTKSKKEEEAKTLTCLREEVGSKEERLGI